MINTDFIRKEGAISATYRLNSGTNLYGQHFRAVEFDIKNDPTPVAFRCLPDDPVKMTRTSMQEVGDFTLISATTRDRGKMWFINTQEGGQKVIDWDFGINHQKYLEASKLNPWLAKWLDEVDNGPAYLPEDFFPVELDTKVFLIDNGYERFLKTYPGIGNFVTMRDWKSCYRDLNPEPRTLYTWEENIPVIIYRGLDRVDSLRLGDRVIDHIPGKEIKVWRVV